MSAKRARWTEKNLQAAMAAVKRGQLSQLAAANLYGIPRRTLRNHLETGNLFKRLGKSTIMNKEQENDLVQRILRFADMGTPITPRLIRKQAFTFCEKYKLKHNFNTELGLAGRNWLKLFLKRHSEISITKALNSGMQKTQKFNLSNVASPEII